MRIVIDLQGVQTESRLRGIGRYSLSFAKAVARNRGEHEVFIALSGLLPENIATIRAELDGILPYDNIRVWSAPGPVSADSSLNAGRRAAAELVREAFLQSLQPDLIHVSSMFEGYVDDAVTSIGRLGFKTPVSVSLYDLIPLLNPDFYLKNNKVYADFYLEKVEYIRRASLCLAISNFARNEGVDALGGETQFVNVSAALDDNFKRNSLNDFQIHELKSKYGVKVDFILYAGGADGRKNLQRLIQAFAELPRSLRNTCQLLFAGKIPDSDLLHLKRLASKAGLGPNELLFSGYVSDEELVRLYSACRLYVFPSWHEGFGLPVLEAMACGAPVIGSNVSSLPEVIGLDEAMFDPFDVSSISRKIAQALEDPAFCERLKAHGLVQAKRFSWDETALRAIRAWESLPQHKTRPEARGHARPRLAFVSPMPPERTGIADYSADLLPALAAHYDIELVVAQESVSTPWVVLNLTVRDSDWLRAHAHEMDRVVYQMGNSPFHWHMFDLMEEIPGTVVLHDFFLGHLLAWAEVYGSQLHWMRALLESHGYMAIRDAQLDAGAAKFNYPVNWAVIESANGVICHSFYSKSLARRWYGSACADEWHVIPLVRTPVQVIDRVTARRELGIADTDFVVCSFGFLAQTKMNDRLLRTWLGSGLSKDERCRLVFVGENSGDEYGAQLIRTIEGSGLGGRIRITGFASSEDYARYLAAADLAVQLRTNARGETSASVLDCMNYGLPLIVNANGSMAELDPDAIRMLPDEFEDQDLLGALESLWRDAATRKRLGEHARAIIHERHNPAACARQYAEAIEYFEQRCHPMPALIDALALQDEVVRDDVALARLSQSVAASLPVQLPAKRLLLDVSATCRHDLKTGIERVARALLMALLEAPPAGYRIEPVYLSNEGGVWHYRLARAYTLKLLGVADDILPDEALDVQAGDVLLVADISGDLIAQADASGLFSRYAACGVRLHSVVYDLLPIRMPWVFPEGADIQHSNWLRAISGFDGAVCISQAVADDLTAWRAENAIVAPAARPYRIDAWHLGADLASSAPSKGLPEGAEGILAKLGGRPTFLMVGTIEPRKGYLQALEAFDLLWAAGHELNLVVVGREGWKGLPDLARRDIPATIARLRAHPELNSRLFWLEGISDEFLEMVYAKSSCLLAASYGEGFGLPLIEAAQKKLPILARDIPVFREVAGEHASYFDGESAESLQRAIKGWVEMGSKGEAPLSEAMPWLSWAGSARNLLGVVGLADRFVG